MTTHKLSPQKNAFADWIDGTGLNLRQIAKLLGFSHTFVSNLRCNNVKPGLESAMVIEQVSNGEVPAESWFPRKKARR